MVMEGAHQEQSLAAGELEVETLQHDRAGGEHEDAGEQHEQQLGAGEDGHRRHDAADRHRADVAHEDLRLRGVPPEEADESTDEGCRDDSQIEGVRHGVAAVLDRRLDGLDRTGLLELPERDQAVGADHEDAGPGGEAVQAVREIDAVRGGDADEREPDEVEGPSDDRPEREEPEHRDVSEQGDELARRRDP
ncbi:hypothetical protein ABE10_00065 [Bacillus toyonensis]|nr:hypothetical protein [Bacillus toyonensis]